MPGGLQTAPTGGEIEDVAVTDLLKVSISQSQKPNQQSTITNQQSWNFETSYQASDVNFVNFLHLRPKLDIKGLCLSLFYNAKVKVYVKYYLFFYCYHRMQIKS